MTSYRPRRSRPTAYNFAEVMLRGLRNIGVHAKVVDGMNRTIGPNSNLIDPAQLQSEAMTKREIHEALPEALELIHRSVDRGYPVLAWDIFFPEFGLIYGYDDEERQLNAYECGRRDPLPYENLGRSVLEEIFLLAINEMFQVSPREQMRNTLQMILDHYDGKEDESTSISVKGIRAYEVWCEAYQAGTVEPNGNSYNIAVIRDGRKSAAQFLKEVQTDWPIAEETDRTLSKLMGEAAELYTGIAEHFDTLHKMFPFPEGGEPNTPAKSEKSIELLLKIKEQESSGKELFRQMLNLLG
jgi:hypothetical protein